MGRRASAMASAVPDWPRELLDQALSFGLTRGPALVAPLWVHEHAQCSGKIAGFRGLSRSGTLRTVTANQAGTTFCVYDTLRQFLLYHGIHGLAADSTDDLTKI
jgi:hypothetical protein